MANPRLSQSEIDGVQYRRAKLWQIILVACNALNGMAFYSIINLSEYVANIGFGIKVALVGGLLTALRIFDAFTDPILAFVYDRFNTRWGKVRPLMLLGWLIQSAGLLALFCFVSSKGFGVWAFLGLSAVVYIGYTMVNMTAQTLPALITNDPKQRPQVGVWSTALNYLVPMALMIVINVILLPRFGTPALDEFGEVILNDQGEIVYTYTQAVLSMAAYVCVGLSLVGVILTCAGVSAYDKPENFKGIRKSEERLKLRDMWGVLKNNKPLQSYIISAASDKIAQQAASASIVGTMLSGILIGNMKIATYLQVGGMLPSILFAIYGARYATKHGNKESIVTWTRNSIIVALVTIVFFVVIKPSSIASFGLTMILYILLTLLLNGVNMCVTTANNAFMADIIDYELDRSGQYVPAVVTGTYSLIDKVVSAFSKFIATGCVALIGYVSVMPQPGDKATPGVFWVTMFLKYGLAILGWICTLLAMRRCRLTKAEMIEVQKRVGEKKDEARQALLEKELHKGDPENA